MVAQVPASVQRQGGWAAQAPSVGIESGMGHSAAGAQFFLERAGQTRLLDDPPRGVLGERVRAAAAGAHRAE